MPLKNVNGILAMSISEKKDQLKTQQTAKMY